MFKICARTVLELGAELISSDVIAFYELIKNAFDAGSSTGAEIRFEIALRRNDYLKFRRLAADASLDLSVLKSHIEHALNTSAPQDSLHRFREAIRNADTRHSLVGVIDDAYSTENRIIVSDNGSGMSQHDLINNYLVIGTPSRKHAIDAALAHDSSHAVRPPYLGEKGIGRLSAMRLGDQLTVETAQREDERLNCLEIDWSAFRELDLMLDEVRVSPHPGNAKPDPNWSGTRLLIASLSADWNYDRVKHLGEYDFARLTDPFADAKRRPRVAMYWNGTRIPVAYMDPHFLTHAHATVKGKFFYRTAGPTVECTFEALDLGFEHPHEVETREFQWPDLQSSVSGTSREISPFALNNLGPFEFEAYWFNRQRLGSIDTIGDQKVVRDLQKRWSGILLFRDGFRVFPYGEDEDDWLALDRRALGSTGYLLNKAQFLGRVTISRLANPQLTDQTNREGLRVCDEQQAFVALLQLMVQSQLRDFLKDVRNRYKNQPVDIADVSTNVPTLLKRAGTAIRRIKQKAPAAAETADDLLHTLVTVKHLFHSTQQRVREIEGENRQMIQLAGVGLLVEVVAHELARSTENALTALNVLRREEVPKQIRGLLESLRAEMNAVGKRLRVLDPLSISGRQRKEVFDVGKLLEDILSGHEMQFKRHNIRLQVIRPERTVRVRAVKGMIVQIVENLLSNSLYWLDLRRHHESRFVPCVTVRINVDPLTIIYEDNGRGIAVENKEKIFRAFFSLKEKSKRRGLGLFIARECAEYHGGTLRLDTHVNQDTGRLHCFVLELPDKVVVS